VLTNNFHEYEVIITSSTCASDNGGASGSFQYGFLLNDGCASVVRYGGQCCDVVKDDEDHPKEAAHKAEVGLATSLRHRTYVT
jgi:hypothetical protein